LTAFRRIPRLHNVTATPKHLTLRNVPRPVMRALERERRHKRSSLNQAAIDALARALGVHAGEPVENGLATLAGTWTDSDLRAFQAATSIFEKVDDEPWK